MGLRDADGGYGAGDGEVSLIVAIKRVAMIKAAIVFAAAMATAVIAFMASYRVFGFDMVSRGHTIDYFTIGWAEIIWLTLPNLIAAVFVRRWWIRQNGSESITGKRPSVLPRAAGFLTITLALLLYYFLTFTALLKP